MTKRVIVHIGRHKTGTTALQRALANGRAQLEAMGFIYPGASRDHAFVAYCLEPEALKRLPPDEQARMKDLFTVLDASLGSFEKDLIISSEGLQNIAPSILGKWLSGLDVNIVVYLREQMDYLISSYQQEVKDRTETLRFPEWARKILTDHPSYIDYYSFISRWSEVFGSDRIIVRVFDKEALVNKDIVSDFLSAVGIKEQNSFLVGGKDPNPSIAGALLEAKRRINQLGFDEYELRVATYGPLRRVAAMNNSYRGLIGVDSMLVEQVRGSYKGSNNLVAEMRFGKKELFAPRPIETESLPDEDDVRIATSMLLDQLRQDAPEFAAELTKRMLRNT